MHCNKETSNALVMLDETKQDCLNKLLVCLTYQITIIYSILHGQQDQWNWMFYCRRKVQSYKQTRIRSVERGICPIATVCTVLLSLSRDPGHANVSETFVRGHVATIPGTCLSNVKFVPLAVLELLAFNAQKFTGVTWPWPRPHRKLLSGVGTIPGNTPAKFEIRIFSRFGAISI